MKCGLRIFIGASKVPLLISGWMDGNLCVHIFYEARITIQGGAERTEQERRKAARLELIMTVYAVSVSG